MVLIGLPDIGLIFNVGHCFREWSCGFPLLPRPPPFLIVGAFSCTELAAHVTLVNDKNWVARIASGEGCD